MGRQQRWDICACWSILIISLSMKIALCMIIKNEEHIIERCIKSALPLIDSALIVDTGSTDKTVSVVSSFFMSKKIPFKVITEKWRDFATNRTSALKHARLEHGADYLLMIDADDVVNIKNNLHINDLKKSLFLDLYNLNTTLSGHSYLRPQLISAKKDFFFKGKIHEYIDCLTSFTQGVLDGIEITSIQDSNRNKDCNKFIKDAQLIEKLIENEPDPFLKSRYTFYCAQSYRDASRDAEAYNLYLDRTKMGFWDQEIYISYYMAAQLGIKLNLGFQHVTDLFLSAFETCPDRAEALHGLAFNCRLNNKFNLAYLFAKKGELLSAPKDALFVSNAIYEYSLLDELSVAAYWLGKYQECFDICRLLLNERKIPENDKSRILENMKFAKENLY